MHEVTGSSPVTPTIFPQFLARFSIPRLSFSPRPSLLSRGQVVTVGPAVSVVLGVSAFSKSPDGARGRSMRTLKRRWAIAAAAILAYAALMDVTRVITIRQDVRSTEAQLDYAVQDFRANIAGAIDNMLGYIAYHSVRDLGRAEARPMSDIAALAAHLDIDDTSEHTQISPAPLTAVFPGGRWTLLLPLHPLHFLCELCGSPLVLRPSGHGGASLHFSLSTTRSTWSR